MNEILKTVLSLSLSGTLLILVLLVVIARLLIPLAPETNLANQRYYRAVYKQFNCNTVVDWIFPALYYSIFRITFEPKDSIQYYCFAIDTGADAQIAVNGKKYKAVRMF